MTASLGGRGFIWPLTMLSCNHTRILASTSTGAGPNYTVTLSVGGQVIGFSAVLSYAGPSITDIQGDLMLPTTGWFASPFRPGTVVIVGSNFGPSGTNLTVTYGRGEIHSSCG